MERKMFLKVVDQDGKEKECEILMVFKWTKTDKNYIVYTDNSKDENCNLNIYAGIYYPQDKTRLDSIETDEEWDEIDRRLIKLKED